MALLNNLDFSNLTKPTTKEEALDVYHSLSVQLATWAVSGLPGLDAKAIMTLLWADQKVAGLHMQGKSCWRASK